MIVGDPLHGQGGDAFAIPEHGDMGGDGRDFLESVGDVEDSNALGGEFADDFQEPAGLLFGEGGGGFVHDDHARPGAKGTCDFHQLLFRHRQGADFGFRRKLRADAPEQGGGGLEPVFPVDPGECALGLKSEADVFSNGEVGKEGGLLVNAGDSFGPCRDRGQGRTRFSAEQDFTGVGRVCACHDLDQRGFSGAIFTEQRVDLAREQGDGNAAQSAHGTKGFGDAAEFKDGGHGRRPGDGKGNWV